MMLKDVEHHNEILNPLHVKLCLNIWLYWMNTNSRNIFTLFNKTLSQTVLIVFQKAYTENLHNCNDTERRWTSQWTAQHSEWKALPSKFDWIKLTQTTAAACTPVNKTLSQTVLIVFQKAYTENLHDFNDAESHSTSQQILSRLNVKLCLKILKTLSEQELHWLLLCP